MFKGGDFHRQKVPEPALDNDAEEIGVSHPCADMGNFVYFAGAKTNNTVIPENFNVWELPQGEYIVCTFEAESFEALVMNVLYKAEYYLYGTWLPSHKLQTEPFCAERYENHTSQTAKMEIWMKLVQ